MVLFSARCFSIFMSIVWRTICQKTQIWCSTLMIPLSLLWRSLLLLELLTLKDFAKLIDYFLSHRLNMNAEKKTEFIVFCKPSKNTSIEKINLQVHSHSLKHKECVIYLGVHLDQNLNYQNDMKHILRKMACGIKTIYSVRDSIFLPTKT